MFAYLYVYLCRVSDWSPKRTKEATGSPGTGIPDGYERACGRWELNPSLL